jgi:hypothetical protein
MDRDQAADLPPIRHPGGPPAGWDRSADLLLFGFMLAIAWQVFSVYYRPARFDDDHPRGR